MEVLMLYIGGYRKILYRYLRLLDTSRQKRAAGLKHIFFPNDRNSLFFITQHEQLITGFDVKDLYVFSPS